MPYPKQQVQIDMSGRRGLGDKYYGDINNFGFTGDHSLGQPQYRVNVKDANQDKDGTIASGIFNPLRKYGYLSPSVATMYPITFNPTAIAKTFTYDPVASPALALILTSTTTFITGQPVQCTTTGTLPSGLSLLTTYYTIKVDSTHMRLATTLANALAATALDPGNAGSGTHTVTSVAIGTTYMAATIYDSINDKPYFLTGISSGLIPLYMLNGIDSEVPYADHFMPSGSTAGGDLEFYTLGSSPVRHLFYTYNDGSHWRIGVKNLATNAYNDDWLKTTVSGNFDATSNGEMKLVPGGDGFMYVLNANHVHRIDGTTLGGTNGTITQDVLLAPDYFRFSHGVDFRQNLYIAVQKTTAQEVHNATVKEGANFTSDCGVYIWNRQASFSNTADYIPIVGVREIRALWVSPKNDIRCITVAANGVTQIRIFDGTLFKVVKELGACAYPNYSDSLTVVGGFTVWLGYDGLLYYNGAEGVDINITNFGSVQSEKEFLFIMGNTGGTGIQNNFASALLYAGSNGFSTGGTEKTHPEAFHLFYNVGGTATWSKYFPFANTAIVGGTTVATAADTTPIFYPEKMLPSLSTLKHITIMCARETGLSAAVNDATIGIYINGNTTALMTKTITTDDIMKGYKAIEVNTAFVDSVQLSVTYINTPTSNKRFNPMYAVIDFFPTDTIK